MRTSLFFSVLVLSLLFHAQSEAGSSCLETAMTQREMNQCAGIGLKEADNELNRVYQKVRKLYKGDSIFLKKLKKAQKGWIKLRDADFELMYPHTDEPGYYGSVFPMCESIYRKGLTLERVAFLKRWLTGSVEGDVCSGSPMLKWKLEELMKK